ncbi:MAG: bifunctional hydroxymethylpyrimidine kinase/phosphomethylpyrimidine kinase [Planctomycetes bacterium]|nr:bifunctional hydroxymethylpyrimidine kinase/phosphomethylpyrimidine kinase [Planctomycetota bacterium]
MPRVLLLGGLDPSGGAGLTVDATVVALHHGEPLPLALTFTDQGLAGFRRQHAVSAEQWGMALRTVLADGPLHAVKVGLVPDAATVRTVARELGTFAAGVPVVVDPVLSATSGGLLGCDDLAAAYLEHLVPKATVFTPNVPELAAVCGGDPARALRAGAGAVLVKGGHAEGATCDDVLHRGADRIVFRRERLPVGRVRGTGCTLAAAIAARLAHGASLGDACRFAGDWLAQLLRVLGPAERADTPPRLLPFARVPPAVAREQA